MISKYKVFIDSKIPMYAAGKEHENKKPAIRNFIACFQW